MKRRCVLIVFFLLPFTLGAQELFQQTEPASNIPKGALGVKAFSQSYNEINRIRNMFAVKVMYGITPRLTVMVTGDVSNHHNKELPPGFPEHNTPQIGVHHPYLFNGVDVYAKYRFITIDGQNSHFRAAIYGEYAYLSVAHDEAEPTLLDDTRGFGGGLITTYLKKHFAVSFTGGFIKPSDYYGAVADDVSSLPSVPAKVVYGNAAVYDLSFGYLLFPKEYKSYNQTNWSVYLEFLGKDYGGAQVYFWNLNNGPMYQVGVQGTHVLHAWNYVEAYPGLQCVIKSNLRIDVSLGFPVIDKSYVHFYPLYNFGIQRYFYFKKKG
jgi:hypothetical protein